MYFQSIFLTLTGLSLALALKNPSLCPDGKGNSFVCGVIEKVKDKASYPSYFSINTDGITVATNGQSVFFDTLQSLSVLSKTLSSQTIQAMSTTQNKQWSRFLDKASDTLSRGNNEALDLYYTAVTSVKRFQSSLTDANSTNANRIAATAENAIQPMQSEADRQLVLSYLNVHQKQMEECWESFVSDVETLQNKTRQTMDGYYDLTIDLLDQVGKCVASGPDARCAKDAQKGLSKLNSLPGKLSSAASDFNKIGGKKFDKYPCTVKAGKDFDSQVKKITRDAKTTPPTTTSAPTTAAAK